MSIKFTLISHALCPYVQRVVITLKEKQINFERIDIDLANKPEWFLKISPLGKTPVLLVDEQPIFESAVICEYLEDTRAPALHPTDPLKRARHRSWIEFASTILNAIGAFYNAQDIKTFETKIVELQSKFRQLEDELISIGYNDSFFNGSSFSLVDAVFAPVFRYFDVFDTIGDFGVFTDTPRVCRWRNALQTRPSIQQAVEENYPDLLHSFLIKCNSEISRRIKNATGL
jgi:glutathione S-transferase